MAQPSYNTPREAALAQIEVETPKHEGDLRGAYRAAEVRWWDAWQKSGPNSQERNSGLANAAITCADLYHERFGKQEQAAA